jgi:hypothetical protein
LVFNISIFQPGEATMKIRLIVQSTPNGNAENVHFTDELTEDIELFIKPGYSVDSDDIIDVDLPASFPLNYALERE